MSPLQSLLDTIRTTSASPREVRANKRIYMTATPRIYGDSAKKTAEQDNIVLCSMDDESMYGPTLPSLTFSQAVRDGPLADYKCDVAPDYRERYADNLSKELPRIPRVRAAWDFWAFSKAGRELAELHVGYEKVPEYPATVENRAGPSAQNYRVKQMKFGKADDKGKDKTVIHYNSHITVRDIPIEAYTYVVNGKSAIEWVMERQSVTPDKATGIVKDAHDWAVDTMGDPRYPLSLLLRVITVSLETTRIVDGLPGLVVSC